MSELPKKSLIALAKHLPSTAGLELLHKQMLEYIDLFSSREKTDRTPSVQKFQIDDLAHRVSKLIETPLGFELIVAFLPILIEISKSGDTPPEEPEPAIV